MSHAVLIFTLSPVQSFISEARRAGDLYAGSHILVQMAQAALGAIVDAGGTIVYPASGAAADAADIPNKLVATIPLAQASEAGEAAERALQRRWAEICACTRGKLDELGLPGQGDPAWEEVWQRQTGDGYLWQCFWAAAPVGDAGYAEAYRTAGRALDAVKRARIFNQATELAEKDSLSGRREALHRQGERAPDYWCRVAGLDRVTGAMLRADGRERLDAIGAVKRFWPGSRSFVSTSTVAAAPFLTAARLRAPVALGEYRDTLKRLPGGQLHGVDGSADWPYDGDLLFAETLTLERLQGSYGVKIAAAALTPAQEALGELYRAAGAPPPSPYYAVIVLDGDWMGEHIDNCLRETDPERAHGEFGSKLLSFSGRVGDIGKTHEGAHVIYNGGDDVLALAPLRSALGFAHALAQAFAESTGATASAGIAIAHHLTPLDAVLREARQAESQAKEVPGKAALCVTLMRRGGEHTTARGPWSAVMEPLQNVTTLLTAHKLSSSLPYDLEGLSYAIPKPCEEFRSELGRVLSRRSDKLAETEVSSLAEALRGWAAALPGDEQVGGLACWLRLARFLAGEEGGEDAPVS